MIETFYQKKKNNNDWNNLRLITSQITKKKKINGFPVYHIGLWLVYIKKKERYNFPKKLEEPLNTRVTHVNELVIIKSPI